MKKLDVWAIALGIFLLNVYLNWPIFLPGEMPFRGSIEGGYAGMARFVAAHPNPWGWNPFQYGGLPVQFMYVPALPYLTAAAVRVMPSIAPEYAYRLIASTATCLGPVTLFLFALCFTGSKKWAAAAALVYSLFSPSYGLFPQVEKDRGIVQLPWRVQVLAKYGEGPHNTGLMLLPLALLAVWRAAKRGGYPRILLAAVVLAAIPLTNWVSAFSLALACLLLLLAGWGEPEFRHWRALAAAALAYLLACFWLTPSFVQTIAFNWAPDSFGYHFGVKQRWLAIGLVGAVIVVRAAAWRLRAGFYFGFVLLGTLVFGWIATAYYVYGIDTIPESRRYALEFELFLASALVEAVRRTLGSKNHTVRLCAQLTAGVMLLVGTPQLFAYLTQGSAKWRPMPKETTVEYRMAKWIAERKPQGRVFASGGLRFRLNSWFEMAQVGGGFETGLQNRMPVDLAYHIRTGKEIRPGREPQDMLLELKALDVQYVAVHGPKSKEYYRDFAHPEWLAAVANPVYREGDDAIYELPASSLALAASPQELPEKDANKRPWVLGPLAAAMDDPSRQLRATWRGTSAMDIDGAVADGRVVSVLMNADAGWHASQDGREIAIERDRLGFMTLRPAVGAAPHIELRYRSTAEQRVMAGISALAWICGLGVLAWKRA